MKVILETPRLLLRELTPEDAENFYKLNENPNVTRYTGDGAFDSIEHARVFLENYQDYILNGYGRWAVINKQDKQFIGWCGLKYHEMKGETDIGFRFFEQQWNKGYATESTKVCLDYGFKHLNLKRIIGRAMKDNIGSIKVLQKIGLVYEKDVLFDGKQAVLYSIEQ